MACHCLRSSYALNSISLTKTILRNVSLLKVFNSARNQDSISFGPWPNYARRPSSSLCQTHHRRSSKSHAIALQNNVTSSSKNQKRLIFDDFVTKRYSSSSKNDVLSSNADVQAPYTEEKTKLTIINEQKDGSKPAYPFIFKYSTKGFTIGDNKVYGSVALLQGCVFSWKVLSQHQITPESLSLFAITQPKLEILILGLGDRISRISPDVWEFCRQQNILLEVLDTPNACATYNFLTEEGRITAAALIPPQTIKI